MTFRLNVRVFITGVLASEERVDVLDNALDKIVELAGKHGEIMAGRPGMVEIEFLDEPDVNRRFWRIGTDPAGMRDPIAVDLVDPMPAIYRYLRRKP